ncbi:hypothetical protein F2Q69_00006979 [Brassica cretica]|uniref:Uncharacterized protein n=1 Tax=Brassica cretica TaxID=69181 RepID=A0A8S9P8T5_BRACR|nr:hypothetical protein F2Q69_00006979 [Brassica cretica]
MCLFEFLLLSFRNFLVDFPCLGASSAPDETDLNFEIIEVWRAQRCLRKEIVEEKTSIAFPDLVNNMLDRQVSLKISIYCKTRMLPTLGFDLVVSLLGFPTNIAGRRESGDTVKPEVETTVKPEVETTVKLRLRRRRRRKSNGGGAKATVEARQTRLWSSSALASPPHHHHRFIKEQGKEKKLRYIAASPVKWGGSRGWGGGRAVGWWSCGGDASIMVGGDRRRMYFGGCIRVS